MSSSVQKKRRVSSAILLLLAAGIAAGVVALILYGPEPGTSKTARSDAPAVPAVAEPESEPTQTAEVSAPEPNASTEPEPSFDLVRVDPEGGTLIAGTAAPGDEVRVMLDGVEVARAQGSQDGSFVAIIDVGPTNAPRVLTLEAQAKPTDVVRQSEASVILAPVSSAPLIDATPVPEASSVSLPSEKIAIAPEPDAEDPVVAQAAPTNAALRSESQLAVSSVETQKTAPSAAPKPDAAAPLVSQTLPRSVIGPDTTDSLVASHPDSVDVVASSDELDVPLEVAAVAPVAGGETATQGSGAPKATVATVADLAPAKPVEVASAALESEAEASPAPRRAPAVLIATADGVRVLQPGARRTEKTAPSVSVDAISYNRDGTVVLAGNGNGSDGSDTQVRIYLNNKLVKSTPVAVDGNWKTPLDAVEAGIYTLRVDKIGPDGKVAARFETPFKREATEVLARRAPVDETLSGVAVSVITVQPGYTLWSIASDRYGDGEAYVKVFQANDALIKDPDLIYPGQVFDLPD